MNAFKKIRDVYDILHRTLQGQSNISSNQVSSLKRRNGNYQFHLLNNIASSLTSSLVAPRMLAIGSSSDTHMIAPFVGNTISATFVLQHQYDGADAEFRDALSRHFGDSSGEIAQWNALIERFANAEKKGEPIRKYNILFLGYYANIEMIPLIIPHLTDDCFIVVDDIETGDRLTQYTNAVHQCGAKICYTFYSKTPLDDTVDRRKRPFNPSTWWAGALFARCVATKDENKSTTKITSE